MSDRSPAIVLATRPLQEADLLVVLLTPDHGKIRCAARSARKSRKRFAGGLPGGALGEATLRPGGVRASSASRPPDRRASDGRLWRLDAFRSVHDLSGLGRDLQKFAYVAYLCELTDALVHEPEPDPRRFAALAEAIAGTLRGADPGILRRFELRLLDTLGLLPTLQQCCICGTLAVTDDVDVGQVAFEGARGGVLCLAHAQPSQPVSATALRLAQRLLDDHAPPGLVEDDELGPAEALRELAAAGTDDRRALRDLTRAVIHSQLRRPLRSLEFLRQIGRTRDHDR